jgi:carbonic anhydrase
LETQKAFVGHTDCGMQPFTNGQIRGILHNELGAEAAHIDFQPFPDVADRVAAIVRCLRESNLGPNDYPIKRFVYDVKTGRIDEVEV